VLIIPAIDLLGGRCVRLVQGDYQNPTVYSDDPNEVAAEFANAGSEHLHVVDLDAARGGADNKPVIASILRRKDLKVQVAGGIRSSEAVDFWLGAGAHAVVMGTAAVRDPLLLERCARLHPGRVLAALDLRDDKPAVTGWTNTEPVMIGALLGSLIVAGVEVLGSYYLGSAWKEVIYFVLFIAVLVFRPAGLFGQRGSETLGA